MVEYSCKIEEKVKAMQSEIKKNIQGTNSKEKETSTQVNVLEQKEEVNIQPEQNEETRIPKNDKRLRNLQDNFKCSNIPIIMVPEGEKEEQEMENLFEQIMKENFPLQSGNGNSLPGSPGGSESPKEVGPRETHAKAHHNYITQDKREGENLKGSREERVTYKGVPIRLSADFSKVTI